MLVNTVFHFIHHTHLHIHLTCTLLSGVIHHLLLLLYFRLLLSLHCYFAIYCSLTTLSTHDLSTMSRFTLFVYHFPAVCDAGRHDFYVHTPLQNPSIEFSLVRDTNQRPILVEKLPFSA